MYNKSQKQFVGGTVGKGKKYTLHLDEYMQAMAIARTFVKPAEREGFWIESAIELLAGCMMYFQKKSGELLYVDVDQTLDLLQKATEQEDYVAELMTSIGENQVLVQRKDTFPRNNEDSYWNHSLRC
ncbi:hypothetical protein [Bacillus sp. FSL K6-0067]|uniref:hypothetical protein n=1 Tax=Bacillus sp. FSL K6-0067 TaxID=2921412 RepID=UPI0030F63FE5